MAKNTPQAIKRKIDEIIIHCAATPNGKWFTTQDIDRWHGERGFNRPANRPKFHESRLLHIGYHLVIYTGGSLALGRHFEEVGAHAYGHNSHSIGICLIGTDKFSRAQWEALAYHIKRLQQQFPEARVIGHRDIDPHKSCPGFDVAAWLSTDMQIPEQHLLEDADVKRPG